jgi:hypothetical protein
MHRTVRALHGALVAGMILAGGTFVFLIRVRHGKGLLPAPSSLGLVLAGLGLSVVAAALLILRGRIPERASGEDPPAFWSAQNVGAAIALWAGIEAGGLLGMVGYLLTGGTLPAAAGAVGIAVMVFMGPARLEGEGGG